MKTVGSILLAVAMGAIGCNGSTDVQPGSGGTTGGGTGGTTGGGSGGTTGGGNCGKVQACGGALVGTWTASTFCVLDNSFLGMDAAQICPTATIDLSNVGEQGTLTYNSDLTYQQAGTTMFQMKLTIPNSCLAMGETCETLDSVYKQMMQTDPTYKMASCAAGATSCVCTIAFVQDSNESGTYSTMGTNVTTTPTTAGATVDTSGYCVQGNQLHLLDLDMTMPMGAMGMAKINAELILTKQ